jgi:hypothetical protein
MHSQLTIIGAHSPPLFDSQLKWENGMCRVAWTPEVREKLDLLTKSMSFEDHKNCLHEAIVMFSNHVNKLIPTFLINSAQCNHGEFFCLEF